MLEPMRQVSTFSSMGCGTPLGGESYGVFPVAVSAEGSRKKQRLNDVGAAAAVPSNDAGHELRHKPPHKPEDRVEDVDVMSSTTSSGTVGPDDDNLVVAEEDKATYVKVGEGQEQQQQQQQPGGQQAQQQQQQEEAGDEEGASQPTSEPSPLPTPSLPMHSLIYVDWDDTILCTTWLREQKFSLRTPAGELPFKAMDALRQLEEAAVAFLERCLSLGRVAIVTNAESSWVEQSAARFLPALVPLLDRVRVLSARSSYEAQHPDNVGRWKKEAYLCVLREAFPDAHAAAQALPSSSGARAFNVLSLGDSTYERDALKHLERREPSVLAKSVKFVERPSPSQLRRQLDLLRGELPTVHADVAPVDLRLTVEYL